MKNLKCILAVLASLAVLTSLSGCTSKSDTSQNDNDKVVYYDSEENLYLTPNEEEQKAKENAVITEGKLNTPAQVSDFSINVKSVISLGIRNPNETRNYSAERMAVKVEITNNTSEYAEISSLSDFTVKADGQEFDSADIETPKTAASMIDDFQFLPDEIEAGQTVSGYLAFEVSNGWKDMVISYDPKTKDDNYDAVEYKITRDMVTNP